MDPLDNPSCFGSFGGLRNPDPRGTKMTDRQVGNLRGKAYTGSLVRSAFVLPCLPLSLAGEVTWSINP